MFLRHAVKYSNHAVLTHWTFKKMKFPLMLLNPYIISHIYTVKYLGCFEEINNTNKRDRHPSDFCLRRCACSSIQKKGQTVGKVKKVNQCFAHEYIIYKCIVLNNDVESLSLQKKFNVSCNVLIFQFKHDLSQQRSNAFYFTFDVLRSTFHMHPLSFV